jgi:quercetin dioxygenase-like cupin family protein
LAVIWSAPPVTTPTTLDDARTGNGYVAGAGVKRFIGSINRKQTMAALNAGITPPGQGDRGTVWNILGQTYYLKEVCDTSFAFEVVGEPGTFVPAHVHPTQDEFIYLAEGQMELTLDGQPHVLPAGGLARMPMGIAHSYKNVGNKTVRALFWVTPARKLYELFTRIHNLTDPAQVVAISATCEVNFLPPPE